MSTDRKYPDMTEIWALKEKRRREIEALPPIERQRIAVKLMKLGRKMKKYRDRQRQG